MTIEELKRKMSETSENDVPEVSHVNVDLLLLEYINDDEVTAIYNSCSKWFS